MIGLLEDGNVFLWNKDGEKLQTVCGLVSTLDSVALSQGGSCFWLNSADGYFPFRVSCF